MTYATIGFNFALLSAIFANIGIKASFLTELHSREGGVRQRPQACAVEQTDDREEYIPFHVTTSLGSR